MAPKPVTHHGLQRWLLDLRSLGAGRQYFESEKAAEKYLAELLDEKERYGQLALDLPPETRRRYLALDARASGLGCTIEQALDWWERSHRPAHRKPLGEAIEACLAAKRQAGRRGRGVDQLGYALDSLKRSIGSETICSEITREQVEAWLNNPAWALRTRKGRLIDARTFFSFCRKRDWLARSPADGIEEITLDEKPPEILKVAQVERLMAACRKVAPSFLPFMTLGIFCGVRPEEIKQLAWEQVSLNTGYVEIPAHVAKRVRGGGGRQRRLIELQPNAKAWLALGGNLPPVSWQDQFDRVRKAAGFAANARGRKGKRRSTKGEPWPRNAMRHSFCSYCLPVFGELKESQWAGHSPEIAIARYRELVTRQDAERFWAIGPR